MCLYSYFPIFLFSTEYDKNQKILKEKIWKEQYRTFHFLMEFVKACFLLLSNVQNKDVTASVTIKTADIRVWKSLALHIN